MLWLQVQVLLSPPFSSYPPEIIAIGIDIQLCFCYNICFRGLLVCKHKRGHHEALNCLTLGPLTWAT